MFRFRKILSSACNNSVHYYTCQIGQHGGSFESKTLPEMITKIVDYYIDWSRDTVPEIKSISVHEDDVESELDLGAFACFQTALDSAVYDAVAAIRQEEDYIYQHSTFGRSM